MRHREKEPYRSTPLVVPPHPQRRNGRTYNSQGGRRRIHGIGLQIAALVEGSGSAVHKEGIPDTLLAEDLGEEVLHAMSTSSLLSSVNGVPGMAVVTVSMIVGVWVIDDIVDDRRGSSSGRHTISLQH